MLYRKKTKKHELDKILFTLFLDIYFLRQKKHLMGLGFCYYGLIIIFKQR